MSGTGALVLAAGKGTRMHSQRPKVMQRILGAPMLEYVLRALDEALSGRIWIVAGHGAEILEKAFAGRNFILQEQQLGTGHALAISLDVLAASGIDRILIINGDCPLIDSATIRYFLDAAKDSELAFASIDCADPGAYGRVIRHDGRVIAIVEARDYSSELYGQPTGEINAGIYLLGMALASQLAPRLGRSGQSGEYYITDLVRLAIESGHEVCGVSCGERAQLLGVNSPAELVGIEEMLRASVIANLLEQGTLVHAPNLARISPFCKISPGAEISGPCEIYGDSVVHAGAVIEACCMITDSTIAANAQIRAFSHIEKAEVGPGAIVGPFARLRPGTMLAPEAHVGNFVELKNTNLGRGAKANHLSYLGDSSIGELANIGAGTITCNYDGRHKYRTSIGNEAFIGSNSSLVAPVKIGDRALVGAGSVISKDVPENQLGISRPAQKILPRRKK